MSTKIDNFAARQHLLGAIDGAITTFVELFGEIKPIGSSQNSVNGIGESSSHSSDNSKNGKSINNSPNSLTHLLTSKQYQKVHHLSIHLENIKGSSNLLHRLYHRNSNTEDIENDDDLANEDKNEIRRLQDELQKRKKDEIKTFKIISTLQNLLENEVIRNEEADEQLRTGEDSLLKMTVERNKYIKLMTKINSNEDNGNYSSQSTYSSSTVTQKKDYIGSHVRKKFGPNFFFGFIVSFESPFYKIVYEDGDEEEMNTADIMKVYWESAVPSLKDAQCKRHAVRLGLWGPRVGGSGGGGTVLSMAKSSDSEESDIGNNRSHNSKGNNSNESNCLEAVTIEDDNSQNPRSISTRYGGKRGRPVNGPHDSNGRGYHTKMAENAVKKVKTDVSKNNYRNGNSSLGNEVSQNEDEIDDNGNFHDNNSIINDEYNSSHSSNGYNHVNNDENVTISNNGNINNDNNKNDTKALPSFYKFENSLNPPSGATFESAGKGRRLVSRKSM